MKERVKRQTFKFPKNRGKLDMFIIVDEGRTIEIRVLGDPSGLRYLSKILSDLAEVDQYLTTDPVGERDHVHLIPEIHLGWHSCSVLLMRADAKGTGKLPQFMQKR
jgi:hypothetical protein